MKIFIPMVLTMLVSISTFSQDCKNVVNKKDEFTGEVVKSSKTKITKNGGYEQAYIQIDWTPDNLNLTFIYSNSSMGAADAGMFSCQQGDKIYLLLEDSSVVKLDLKGEGYTMRSENAGAAEEVLLGGWAGLSKSNKLIFEPEYILDLSSLNRLNEKKITKIRVEARGEKGYTGKKIKNIELEIKDTEGKQFKKDVGCLFK